LNTKLLIVSAITIALAHGQGGGGKRVDIHDRVFDRTAYTFTIPANWSFQGAVVPGTSCEGSPFPVYRMSSQDGLWGGFMLPRVDWYWPNSQGDCRLWNRMISAREFLTYMVGILHVGFVREEDVEQELAEFRQMMNRGNTNSQVNMVRQADMARFLVRYELNGHPIEEWLYALVSCYDSYSPYARSHFYACSAYTTRQHAPLGQLEPNRALFKSINKSLVIDQQWNAQWNAMVLQRLQRMYDAQAKALHDAYEIAGAQRTLQHEAFMNAQQRGADLNKLRFAEHMYVKRQVTDDRVDMILDCERDQYGRPLNASCPARQTLP